MAKKVIAPTDIYKKLSKVFLVSSTGFSKATPSQQTSILIAADGLPVQFVDSFFSLSNPIDIRNKLLAGSDVSLELEFNDVAVSDDDMRALELIKPLLEKITKIVPAYPWVTPVNHDNVISFADDSISRNGYILSVGVAKGIWQKASKVWSKPVFIPPSEDRVQTISNGSRYLIITKMQVCIGCQTIKRSEVEFIARHYGWAPSV